MKKESFGSRLRALREEKSLGLRELASQAGISPGFLSKVESGKEKPPAEGKLRALAEALDCDPEVLMALAGRLPADVVEIIRRHPKQYVALLRALRLRSAEELKGLRVYLSRLEPRRLTSIVKELSKITKSIETGQFPATLVTQRRTLTSTRSGEENSERTKTGQELQKIGGK